MTEPHTDRTLAWWRALSGLAALNVTLWIATAATVGAAVGYARWHLALSGVYTAVCAYRSVLPRIDLERTVLWDVRASSVLLGRSAATVAEVSFAAQIALLLHELGALAGFPGVQAAAPWVVVTLATAQAFCWSSVVTLSHLGHAIEETLWGLTFTGVGVALAAMGSSLSGVHQAVALLGALGCAAYVVFMFTVDVPMYVRRWRADDGGRRLGLVAGLRDAWDRREPTRSWEVWRPEVAWLTGYFSLAVWTSLALVHLPR